VTTLTTVTSSSRFGLALYSFGLGLALVANVAGHVMRDRMFLWMGVVGVVALIVGPMTDAIVHAGDLVLQCRLQKRQPSRSRRYKLRRHLTTGRHWAFSLNIFLLNSSQRDGYSSK
jgi:hypothetical protein